MIQQYPTLVGGNAAWYDLRMQSVDVARRAGAISTANIITVNPECGSRLTRLLSFHLIETEGKYRLYTWVIRADINRVDRHRFHLHFRSK